MYKKINDTTINNLKDSIIKHNWDYIYTDNTIDYIFNKFNVDLIRLYNDKCPIIQIKDNKKIKKPWIYSSLIKCINKKNKLYRNILKNKTTEKFIYYKKYKNILTTLLRKSEYLYYSSKLTNNHNNIKNTWAIINKVINTNKKEINLLHNPTSIEFNDYFSSIGPTLAKKIINEPSNEYIFNNE